MKKYVAKHLSHLILKDNSWDVFDENKPQTEEFFLLFNYFKPIDKVLSLPLKIKNEKKNIIFVHRGITPILNLTLNKDDMVEYISFDVDKKMIEPFAVYVKDFNLIDKNDDKIENMLNKIIKEKHVVKKV